MVEKPEKHMIYKICLANGRNIFYGTVKCQPPRRHFLSPVGLLKKAVAEDQVWAAFQFITWF